jgi:predicted porin
MNPRFALGAATCGLLATPTAIAQTSNVQIYGRANLGFDQYQAEGSSVANADRKDRFRVFDNSSRVGLRGTEDLGGGLKAVFQVETGTSIDSGNNIGQGGQTNGSAGFWASRDSFVGLDSNFGRLVLGRLSIYYSNGVNAQFSANYINTEVPWTDGRSFGRVRVPATRTSNTVLYTTPTFAGLNLSAYYSPNAQEAVQAANTQDTDGVIWGGTLRGTWGPFYTQFDYVSNEGNTQLPAGTQSEQTAYKLGASWAYLPGARIGVVGTFAEDNQVIGLTGGDKVEQWSWTVNWEHTFGNIQLMAQYGELGDIKECDAPTATTTSCSDSGATAYMVGVRYLLSKRTWLYASYNKTTNKSNQFADYTNASITSVSGGTFPLGADPQIWALGISHSF